MQAVAIVAHPDDEVIWCGGLLIRNAHWDWTVLSLCRGDDGERRDRFHRVCDDLGVVGIISDLDDAQPLAEIDPPAEIGARITRWVGRSTWDLCVTHGASGEYGHWRHRQVHAEVLRLAREGVLRCEDLWTFAYDADPASGRCEILPSADIRIRLRAEQLARKKSIVQHLYGFGPTSFEVNACVSPEGFELQNRRVFGEHS